MILNELEYTKQISGLVHPILHTQTTDKLLTWTSKTWITDFKTVLTAFDGEAWMTNVWVPVLHSNYVISIMDHFTQYIEDKDTLKIISNCRLYLQIFTLSEMTSAGGTKIQNAPYLDAVNHLSSHFFTGPNRSILSTKRGKFLHTSFNPTFCKDDTLQLKKPRILEDPHNFIYKMETLL